MNPDLDTLKLCAYIAGGALSLLILFLWVMIVVLDRIADREIDERPQDEKPRSKERGMW